MSEPPSIEWITPRDRRRAAKLYDRFWVRNMRSRPRPLPDGAYTVEVATTLGAIHTHVLPGQPGKGTVVLAHPHRRYAGHWFVKTGWVEALNGIGRTTVWFDQRGYGEGDAGSPYLAENLMAVAHMARELDAGPVDVVGLSMGSFVAAFGAPYMPWVRRMVLESPYRSFSAWYDEHGWSMAKFASHAFGRFFPHSEQFDTQVALRDAPQEFLVGASAGDTTTSLRQSEDAIGDHPVTWVKLQEAEHLELWDDATYRDAVMAFLAT